MLHEYMKKNREAFLPECKDFSKDMDFVKKDKNVKAMPYNIWFWCSSDNYQIITYGSSSFSMIFFFTIAYFIKAWNTFSMYVFIIFGLIMAYDLIKKLRKHKYYKNTSLYDLYLRDY